MIGDVLEWLGGVCLVVAAYLYAGIELALVGAALVLIYEAQCLSTSRIPWFTKKPKADEPEQPVAYTDDNETTT
jgi:hypothetical protein